MKQKREGILKRLFGGGKKDCCSIQIEEVQEGRRETRAQDTFVTKGDSDGTGGGRSSGDCCG